MKKSNAALEARASNALTLHLEEFQTKDMIDVIEKRMTESMKVLQELDAPRQKAFDEYQKLQDRFDNLSSKVEADKRLLDNLSKYQNGIKNGVDIRIVRGESHNEMKPREKKKYATRKDQFTWTAYAENALKETGHFMKVDDVWNMVVEKENLIKRIEKAGVSLSKYKWGAIKNCWLASSKNAKEGGKGTLIEIDGYLGMKEWVDENLKPLPEYIPNPFNNHRAAV